MTTKEKPNLLTFPREIRDNIYSHLHHEVVLSVPTDPIERRTQHLKVVNAPIVAVLLTHPQLHHEYRDADCFKNLSGMLYCSALLDHPTTSSTADSRVLSQIRHLEIAGPVTTDPRNFSFIREISSNEDFFHHIRLLVPTLTRLQTLRFRAVHCRETRVDHVCFVSAVYVVEQLFVPHTICGLKMIQTATGCEFDKARSRIVHHLHSTTYYVYANKKANTKKINFCTLAEVSAIPDSWVKLSPATLEYYEKEREGISAALSAKVLGWTDRRMT